MSEAGTTTNAAAGTAAWSEERMAPVGEVELAYQEMGDAAGEPTLMIMGLGSQMIYWPDGLCELLAARDLRLIRFDNRDTGRSTKIAAPDAPSVMAVIAGARAGIPYTLDAMADDTAGLLDRLEIERAHLVGASLGGMIAQMVAVRHPERVLSLASIMSTTGNPAVGQPHPEAIPALLTPLPVTDREAFARGLLAARKVIGSRGFEVDEEATLDLARRAFDRGISTDGTARQFLAVAGSGDRTEWLRGIRAPTVVIHGTADPLIDVSGGEATAAAVPGAELVLIEGMGHDLPRGAWQRIVAAVTGNMDRAGGAV